MGTLKKVPLIFGNPKRLEASEGSKLLQRGRIGIAWGPIQTGIYRVLKFKGYLMQRLEQSPILIPDNPYVMR